MPSSLLLRRIPPVDRLLRRPAQDALLAHYPRALVIEVVRTALDGVREALGRVASEAAGEALLAEEALDARIAAAFDARLRPSLRPVLNATGVVIHTNLGRAPLGERALEALRRVARGYSNLEYDLEAGTRGSRHSHVDGLFRELTGAEAALVVNNNAAAVLLILSALAAGREVIVSRGELIEIGGSFRLPDVMAAGGALLREVGTTNRTRASDYERAIGPSTALLLRAHRSNFAIVGFTETPSLPELVALGRAHGVPVVEDLGSGTLLDLASWSFAATVSVAHAVRDGADLVCFSGDKLLGGPQCGIILGQRALVDRLHAHPLTRALRVGKLTIAALEATVRSYVDGTWQEELPALRALTIDPPALRDRAERLVGLLRGSGLAGLEVGLMPGRSAVGGGSLPETTLDTWVVTVRVDGVTETRLDGALRAGATPVIARVADGRLIWDVRTVEEDDIPRLAALFLAAVARVRPPAESAGGVCA